jgi:RIP metalloprotease RseP
MTVEPTTTEPAPQPPAGRPPSEQGPVPPADGPIDSSVGRAVRLAALAGLVVLLGVTQGVSMLIVVLAIVVMIFLHELGHYVMARRAGMLVTEFFIGFGPRIWSFHRGETEYGIKAIPAGAYVRIVGMSNMEDVEPALEGRTYRQARFRDRLGVAVAGSSMHFLIALVLLFSQFAFVGAPDGDRWQVAEVTPGSAAEAGGVRSGDRILAIDGEPLASFDDFRSAIRGLDTGAVELSVVRGGEELALPLQLSNRMKLYGTIGEDVDVVDSGDALVIAAPRRGGVAERSGLSGGETLVEVNGQPVEQLEDVAAAARRSESGHIRLTARTEGGEIADHRLDLGSGVETSEPAAFVGVSSDPVLARESLPAAVWSSVETFGEAVKVSVIGVGKFLWPPNMVGFAVDAFTGGDGDAADRPTPAEQTPSQVDETRPISIVGVAMLGSDLSSENLSNLIVFLATLNIFIGVFNLFPLLPFDGGHVVIAVYEKVQEVRRRSRERYLADVSRMLPVAYAVVSVLVVVGLLALFVDLTRGVSL